MLMFINQWLWALLFFGLFGLSGGFAIRPFSRDIPYSFLMAPILGLFFIVMGTSILYNILKLTLNVSLIITLISCISLTLALFFLPATSDAESLIKEKSSYTLIERKCLVWAIGLIGFVTFITCFSSIDFGEPAFIFMDGSDHLGYAQAADWLNQHLVTQFPTEKGHIVYESWPSEVFHFDPRFGSYFTLAIISTIYQKSGMFSYDLACAVVLSMGILGVAAIFSRSRRTFFLLCLGLLTNHWLDYACGGYFGKILGYSSSLFVLGIFLTVPRPFSLPQLSVLLASGLVAAIVHPASGSLCFISVVGAVYLLCCFLNCLFNKQKENKMILKESLLVWMLLLGVIIASTGVLSKPATLINTVQFDTTWYNLFLALFDIERFGMSFTHLSNVWVVGMNVAFQIIVLYFLYISIKQRQYSSTSLLLAPYIILIGIIATNNYWIGQQLIGIFYSWFLCAAIMMLDVNKQSKNRSYTILVGLLILAIVLHVPRFLGAIERYAGKERVMSLVFFEKEMDKLADLTKNRIVTVDLNDSMFAIPLIVDIERRPHQSLQWTERGWKVAVGYRDWAVPLLKPTAYRITLKTEDVSAGCAIQDATQQYYFLQCGQP